MDRIKKVMTHKSGNFVFSRKYNYEKLAKYLIEANILNTTIKDIPILPASMAKIDEELMIRSIFSTAAIEGNPLSEEKVSDIILKKGDALNDKQMEIYNLKNLYFEIQQLPPNFDLSLDFEKTAKTFQSIITKNINYLDNIPGKYRNHLVKVGDKEHGGIDTPPKILADIKILMKSFANWYKTNLSDDNCYIKAALAHLYIGLIHPFGQGNGRTARAIEGLILQQNKIKYLPKMLSNYYYKNIDEYYWAFSNTIQSIKKKEYDVTPFLEFVLKGVTESFFELKLKVMFYIKTLALRDFYDYLLNNKEVNKRQGELLKILLNTNVNFSLKDLYVNDIFKLLFLKVSERTARRDVDSLLKQKLLFVRDDGKLQLNFKVMTE